MLRKNDKGFYILETMIAILVFVIGVVGILKLQTVSMESSINSTKRAQILMFIDDYLGESTIDASLGKADTSLILNKMCTNIQNSLKPRFTLSPGAGSGGLDCYLDANNASVVVGWWKNGCTTGNCTPNEVKVNFNNFKTSVGP